MKSNNKWKRLHRNYISQFFSDKNEVLKKAKDAWKDFNTDHLVGVAAPTGKNRTRDICGLHHLRVEVSWYNVFVDVFAIYSVLRELLILFLIY